MISEWLKNETAANVERLMVYNQVSEDPLGGYGMKKRVQELGEQLSKECPESICILLRGPFISASAENLVCFLTKFSWSLLWGLHFLICKVGLIMP